MKKLLRIFDLLLTVLAVLLLLLAYLGADDLHAVRNRNLMLANQCVRLAQAVNSEYGGSDVTRVEKILGSDVIIEREEHEHRFDDLVLVVDDNKIRRVNIRKTCGVES